MKTIIGISGNIGAGKGVVTEYIATHYGAEHMRFSKPLQDILDRLNLEFNRKNAALLAESLRGTFGGSVLSRALIEDIRKSTNDLIVFDGIRKKDELESLRTLSGKVEGNTITQKEGTYFISEGIPHHMIDIVSPNTDYNAYKFVKQSQKVMKDILKRNKIPIIAGGTHFWAQALIEGKHFDGPAPNKDLRKQLDQQPTHQLIDRYKQLNPKKATSIDKKNRVRLIRAIEKELLPSPLTKKSVTLPDMTWLVLVIHLPKEDLKNNIKKRLTKRLDAGLIDEVDLLHTKKRVPWTRLESFGLEYKWCALYLQGKVTKKDMLEKLESDIHKFAKRQHTWLRKMKKDGIKLNEISNSKDALRQAKSFLSPKS